MKMKKYISLIVALLIFASGILITGCSKSKEKSLIDCLNHTKSADSVEVNVSGGTKMNGQTMDIKMNMQAEDIHKDMKCKVDMDLAGQKQEFYLCVSAGNVKGYFKDNSGKYLVKSVDSSQLDGIDITKSLDGYIEVIKENPNMVSKTNNNTYELNIPKEKTGEIYSKITGKTMTQSLDNLKVEFVVDNDGYLQKVNMKSSTQSIDIELNTDYLNYNKKFNVVLPDASN